MTNEELKKAVTIGRATKTLELRWGWHRDEAEGVARLVLQQMVHHNDGTGERSWINVPVMER